MLCEFTTTNTATQAASTKRILYHTTDKLGSAVLAMNSSGTVIENNRTSPYGEAWLAESTPSTNDKKFTTYQRDNESGLDYAMNRYYGNTAGRFESADQGKMILKMPKSLNRYVYTVDDPINKTDETGNSFEGSCDRWAGSCLPDPFSPFGFTGGNPNCPDANGLSTNTDSRFPFRRDRQNCVGDL